MDSKDIVTIVVAILTSGAFSAIINAILAARREKRQEETGVSAGVRMLLYDRIKHLGKAYIQRGSVTSDELEDMIARHKIYHDDLAGNGFLDTLMDSVRSLPIKME